MVRVGVSVEGLTEERFITSLIAPLLHRKGLFLQPVQIFGNVSIDKVKHELERLVYNFDYITTFYDFYGFKGKDKSESKETLEKKIYNCLPEKLKNKLIPYIQMYEFEGILFSSPSAIATTLGNKKLKLWADEILNEFHNKPEAINDSFETAPSKRLLKNSNYRKTTHGPNIAKEIGIVKIRKLCNGFDDWLTKIESLK